MDGRRSMVDRDGMVGWRLGRVVWGKMAVISKKVNAVDTSAQGGGHQCVTGRTGRNCQF